VTETPSLIYDYRSQLDAARKLFFPLFSQIQQQLFDSMVVSNARLPKSAVQSQLLEQYCSSSQITQTQQNNTKDNMATVKDIK